jgi:dihydroneopterin aldolase
MDTVFIEALEVSAVTGVHDWERQIRQRLRLDLALGWDTAPAGHSDALADALDYAAISERTRAIAEGSEYYLLEALAEELAGALRSEFRVPWLRVSLTKPGCIPGARAAGITIERGDGQAR